MKKWIAQKWIAIAEVFGWPVPAWIRRLLPAQEIAALVAAERELTEALKSDSPPELPMPAFLDTAIERAVVESGEVPKRGLRWTDLLIPASAFAMAMVVGFVMLSNRKTASVAIPGEQPEVAVAEMSTPTETSRTLDRIGEGLSTLEQGLIVTPLTNEQKRLTADVASALQYVSRSILPDTYADGVNSRLDALKKEAAKSI